MKLLSPIAFLSSLLFVIVALVFGSGCRTMSAPADPTLHCYDLEDQYRAFGAAAKVTTALGGSGILPATAIPDIDAGARIALGVTSAVLVATGLAFQFVVDDVEASWNDLCYSDTSTSSE